MAIKTWMPVFEPDSLAIMAQEFRSKFGQNLGGNSICYHRDLMEFKILISGERGIEQRGYRIWNFRAGKLWIYKQVTAIFQITEIDSQRAAISDCCSDWLFLMLLIGQPYMASAPQAYRAVQFVNRSKF